MSQRTDPARSISTRPLEVVLVGNPNVGKTTLFNRLTGARQRVGNYPGVTVEKKTGSMPLGSDTLTVIDLPGTYSLAASSADERIVIDVLTGHIEGTARPDVVVCVVDASNLMRNLFLASQVADIGIPIVIALNMMDAARERGTAVDAQALEDRLGVPVVPMVASKGEGVAELASAVQRVIGTDAGIAPMPWPDAVGQALEVVERGIRASRPSASTAPADSPARQVSRVELLRILLDIDSAIPERIGWSPDKARPVITEARAILSSHGLDPVSAEAILRYGRLGELLDGIFVHPDSEGANRARTGRSESIDRLLTHRIWGLIIFVGMMTLVFQSIYTFAGPLMDGIDWFFGLLGNTVGGWLVATPMLRSLVVDGVIAGVGGVIIFLPQILILFFFISLLEDTGYMARAAFLMDKLFSWCGLNGKSFVPMLSSYACAIPGVMAARSIEDPKARLLTILIAPLMSCSARLPIYVLLIGAFIEPVWGPVWAGTTLVAMHFIGLAIAIPVAMVLNRFLVRGTRVPFVMEMPPYRVPQLRDVFWRMWQSGQKFLKRAGTVIFAMTIVIWALCYFPRPASVELTLQTDYVADLVESGAMLEPEIISALMDEDSRQSRELTQRIDSAYIEQSLMGRAGRAAQPLFAPAGFDWKITVGVLASFPAREVIIATLGIVYELGGDVDEESGGLISTLQAQRWEDGPRAGERVFTIPVALSIMVFFALCMQCGSTVAVMARESSWPWAIFAFTYMTVLAWIAAVIVYQVGRLIF